MTIMHICGAPGCRTLTSTGRCDQHRTTTSPIVARHKKERRRRDGRNRAEWNRIRTAVLTRDDYTCVDCGAPATIADRVGGGWHDADLDRYQSVCHRCSGRRDGRRQHTTLTHHMDTETVAPWCVRTHGRFA